MSAKQVAGGHKAAINNDSVPQESKEHSKQVLEDMEGSGEVEDRNDRPKNEASRFSGNVIGGHKATLKNPNVGEEAKEHSRQVLEENGVDVEA